MSLLWRNAYRLVDLARRTDSVRACRELLKTEWLSSAELESMQLERLKNLLIHAQQHIPYYRQQFAEIGFQPNEVSQLSDIEVLPVLTKDEVRDRMEEFKADDFDRWQPRKVQTGGSTGKPLITYKDRGAHTYLQANNLRAWYAAGYEVGDKFTTLANGSLLPKQGSLKNTVYFFLQHARMIPCYHMNSETFSKAVDSMNRQKAKFLFGYSSSIYLLATYIKSSGANVTAPVGGIFTTSDMLYPQQRSVIEEVFGAKVFDVYGCPEGGILSFECEEHNGYHLNQESAYTEIVSPDATGQGRIISTPLFNYAFPLIRYDTGDIGSITKEVCSCGRALPRIAQLGGRIRDFVVLSDGRHIHGAFFNHLDELYRSDWIEKYQVIQESLNHLVIKITCMRQPSEEEMGAIRDSLHVGLMPDMKIDFDLNGVELAPSGKFRLVLSKVKSRWES